MAAHCANISQLIVREEEGHAWSERWIWEKVSRELMTDKSDGTCYSKMIQ